ncbi:MAG: DUF2652 domain-containing protein [Bacteroidota bacterium]|nr:DUF2652 domain-containing protein [Bacteroidota bacterium]
MGTLNENGAALICIPDISGFTKFMAENDIEFSRKIIPPLLRTIVNANSINMIVGEIEGDAVVFYRFGVLPPLTDLIRQCQDFYDKFNESLKDLMDEYVDNFHKSMSSEKLSVKVVCHAAEITSTEIEGITKLIGEDMVVVHKLLKNSITEMEYILLTEKLLDCYTEEAKQIAMSGYTIRNGKDVYEHIGTIKYSYMSFKSANQVANDTMPASEPES